MATLGEKSVGSIVKLNVSGTATDFIVVHQGLPSSDYDSSCDGTWLLMKDIYEKRAWDSSNNNYANSDIHSYLNNTFINLFDSGIKSSIKSVKLPYTKGNGNSGSLITGSSGLSAQIFLLSATEVGYEATITQTLNIEGAVLDYFDGVEDSVRIAYLSGSATAWFLRSPGLSSTDTAWSVYTSGRVTGNYVTVLKGIRPAMMLPTDLEVESDGTIVTGSFSGHSNIGSTWKENANGYANIGGIWKEIVAGYVNIGGIWKEM
jgi:hypothetical protein